MFKREVVSISLHNTASISSFLSMPGSSSFFSVISLHSMLLLNLYRLSVGQEIILKFQTFFFFSFLLFQWENFIIPFSQALLFSVLIIVVLCPLKYLSVSHLFQQKRINKIAQDSLYFCSRGSFGDLCSVDIHQGKQRCSSLVSLVLPHPCGGRILRLMAEPSALQKVVSSTPTERLWTSPVVLQVQMTLTTS